VTPQQFADSNFDLAFDVIRQAIGDETVSAELSAYASEGPLLLVDPTDAEQSAANDRLLALLRESGETVVGLEVERRLILQPR
jgi:hypothetical protein